VNPEHMIVAYNDYSTVDYAEDQGLGTEGPAQSPVARLFELLLKPFRGDRKHEAAREGEDEAAEKAAAQAWIGWSFSDNGGKNWAKGLHPGHPYETEATLAPAIKGFEAASDPVIASTHDKFYVGGIAFTPGGGSAGFVSVLTDYNDTETGRNIRYDFTRSLLSVPDATFFVDKPSVAALGTHV